MLKGGMSLLQLFVEGAAAIPYCCLLTAKEMSEIIFCGLYPSLARNCNCGLKGQFLVQVN